VDAEVPHQDTNAQSAAKKEIGPGGGRHDRPPRGPSGAAGESAHTDRLAAFLGSLQQGIFIGALGTGSNAGVANACLKELLGYAADVADEEVDPFHPERFIDQTARQAFFDRVASEGGVADHLLRLRRNDGSLLWVEVTATPLGALIRDVSERKRSEDESRDLHHQVLQADKMAALGQTISGVAHELNNPLATILSWAERLAESPADDKARRGLDVILKESERAARIVRNLLTFARKRQSTRMMVDVNDIVRDTLALRGLDGAGRHDSPHAASHGAMPHSSINVVEALAPDIPQVFADAHQIKQILLNLVINAEQAMLAAHDGGTLTVRTSHVPERRCVVLEVTDDGPGIPEATRARIFDPFFTTKQVGKGTGLGLSVAYAISQEHGGRIWVDSQPGAGASFFVELPMMDGGGVQVQERRVRDADPGQAIRDGEGGARTRLSGVSTPQSLPTRHRSESATDGVIRDLQPDWPLETFKGRRVLVVEDEAALGAAVSEALSDAGFAVDRASDGEEGLTRLTQGTYDLIVCDLKMPRIDGMQFYRAMAVAAPLLVRRVIFVTGAVAGSDAERFLEETGCAWLAKPFRLGDLLRAAREALA
jgi:two-component system cell cycle sensor histidine kinase/response regulator CckA